MGWIRGGSGGGSSVKPYVIFEDGKWQNANLFDVTISPTGSEYISIVNGELVYGNGTTGISIYSKTNTPFALVVSFYTSQSGMYMQTGRCVRGADARICQNTGTDRYSYHNWNPSYNLPYAVAIESLISNADTQAVFLSGDRYFVKGLYAYDFQNSYCINYWSN
jgi:hypothetical protein